MPLVFPISSYRHRIHTMKKHSIIPIFIPHKGCPNDCVFCNQKRITAHTDPVTPEGVRSIIDQWLTTLTDPRPRVLEVAFFGGSFTAIPVEEQTAYLSVAGEYKDRGVIDKIRLSTRPDCIDRDILDNLARWGTDVIELGVQSFDPQVLKLSGRGHDPDCVYESSRLIQEYGFQLGIQLMIGLPGDTMEKCVYSAEETVRIGPKTVRLYPTVVIENTRLYEMYLEGTYTPLSQAEAVERTKAMYEILEDAGINIIRVGLKSSDVMADRDSISGRTFHPAFRQLVEGEIAREKITALLDEKVSGRSPGRGKLMVDIYSGPKQFSNMIGNSGVNRKYFEDRYPHLLIRFKTDKALADNAYRIDIKGEREQWKRKR